MYFSVVFASVIWDADQASARRMLSLLWQYIGGRHAGSVPRLQVRELGRRGVKSNGAAVSSEGARDGGRAGGAPPRVSSFGFCILQQPSSRARCRGRLRTERRGRESSVHTMIDVTVRVYGKYTVIGLLYTVHARSPDPHRPHARVCTTLILRVTPPRPSTLGDERAARHGRAEPRCRALPRGGRTRGVGGGPAGRARPEEVPA